MVIVITFWAAGILFFYTLHRYLCIKTIKPEEITMNEVDSIKFSN